MRIVLYMYFFLLTCTLQAQMGDKEWILNAKHAIDALNDCKAAEVHLAKVSPQGKNDKDYILYYAKTQDCLKQVTVALEFYNRYLRIEPDNQAIIKRVKELEVQIKIEKDLSGNWSSMNASGIFKISDNTNDIWIREADKSKVYFHLYKEGSDRYEGTYMSLGQGAPKDIIELPDGRYCQVCCQRIEKSYGIISQDKRMIRLYVRKKYAYITDADWETALEKYKNTKQASAPICREKENETFELVDQITR